MSKKIILFELNEVPWRVIQDFTNDFPESTLAQLLPRMNKFETHTEDAELNPWATWPSVHRGTWDKQHTITNFGQTLEEVNREFPSVWDITSRAGIATGMFGSFHTYPLPDNVESYDYYVPDVFAIGSECFPKSIEVFQDWQLSMARKSARSVSRSLPIGKTLRFLSSMPQLGLKARTLTNLGKQIIDERLENWKKTRRRTHQVLIAFDVFEKLLRKHRPQFTTFFSNHVASSMHRYWAAKYPRDYEEYNYSDSWTHTYEHEIDWTMGQFDKMLKRLVRFADQQGDYQIWVASSMGQAATRADNAVRSQFYLLHPDKFMSHLGFSNEDYEIRPAMLPRVIVALKDPSRSDAFAADVQAMRIAGEHPIIMERLDHGVFRISPPVLQNLMDTTIVAADEVHAGADLGFENSALDDGSGMTAYHIRNGSLLVYDPSDRKVTNEEPTAIQSTDITPMILRNFGLEIPKYMNADLAV